MDSSYSTEHQALVERLIDARKKSGLTQVEVAEKLNQSQSYISKIENNQKKIEVIELKRLAKLYGVDPSKLLK